MNEKEAKKMSNRRLCPNCHAKLKYLGIRSKAVDTNGHEFVDETDWKCEKCDRKWTHSVAKNSWY
jgi:RNase P subunit RPR2